MSRCRPAPVGTIERCVMYIGHLTDCYYPVVNGVTRSVELYQRAMRDAGYRAVVLTGGPQLPDDSSQDVVRTPGLKLGSTGYYWVPFPDRRSRDVLGSIEIAHCHHPTVALRLASMYARAPVVYTNHTRLDLYASFYAPMVAGLARTITTLLWPALVRLADLTIAPTPSLCRHLREFGVEGPIEVIPNGIDVKAFQRRPSQALRQELGIELDAIVLIYVGRLAPEKQVDVLIDQYARLRQVQPGVRLLLVGFGPEMAALQRQARALGLSSAAVFTGRVAPDEVVNYLSIGDLFVTMSGSEVMSLTMIEAMAAGLPVVAPDSVGTRDLIASGVNGLIVNSTGDAWSELVSLVKDEGERRHLADGALATSARLDIRDTVRQTLALYETLRADSKLVKRRQSRPWRRLPLLRSLAASLGLRGL